MITHSDLQALRDSFAESDEPGIPASLCTDFARLLGVSDATVSFFGPSDHFTVGASSADARTLDQWEFTLFEGPCFDAAATNASSITETADPEVTLWPRLSAKAKALGYRSLAATPMQVEGRAFGVIELQDRNGTITSETLTNAEQIATEIATLIVGSLSRQFSVNSQGDHSKFHQATGMVMAQLGTTAPAAIDVLRTHAWTHDRFVTDVADDVVSRTLNFQAS